MAKIEPFGKPCANCGATNIWPVPERCRLCGAELVKEDSYARIRKL